jgi:hypothetical protein
VSLLSPSISLPLPVNIPPLAPPSVSLATGQRNPAPGAEEKISEAGKPASAEEGAAPEEKKRISDAPEGFLFDSACTLVISPKILVTQWINEITSKSKLKVFFFPSPPKICCLPKFSF